MPYSSSTTLAFLWILLCNTVYSTPISTSFDAVSNLNPRSPQGWTDVAGAYGQNMGESVGTRLGGSIGSNIGATMGTKVGESIGSFFDNLGLGWVADNLKKGQGFSPASENRPNLNVPKPNPQPSSPYPQPFNPQPAAPATGGGSGSSFQPAIPSTEALKASVSITTAQDLVNCRKYPDIFTPDMSKIKNITSAGTALEVKCWTKTEMGGDGIWLQTKDGCYINQANVRNMGQYYYPSEIKQCAPVNHWVGKLKDWYQRKDCYACTSLNCQSINLGNPPYTDLACSVQGDMAAGNTTWFQSTDDMCFFPAGIFNTTRGIAGPQCGA
ncbi:hypothetical protein EJ08DRAFT_696497 [Tothia fuscella]|uniref:Cyanovirin-N domain-containing protein n=1 Tax=Tothia fuscella TaxID=1048955 RepID=A0A9P4NSL7_9PEZI|nr:hypothetical protein EJ08DRAFT_696497 [Tothia fuscella]